MTINRRGGKHKHFKRTRNNTGEDKQNPKNIEKAMVQYSEYYAIILKSLGNKRFEIRVVDTLWKGKKRIFNASLRGSKKMRRFRSILSRGAQNNRLIKIGYDESISLIDVIHAFHDWESIYLQDEKREDGERRIILDTYEDNNSSFKFDLVSNNNENQFKGNKKEKNSISIKDLTGIPSSDEEDEEYNFAALNPQKYKKDNKYNSIPNKEIDDNFIDNI